MKRFFAGLLAVLLAASCPAVTAREEITLSAAYLDAPKGNPTLHPKYSDSFFEGSAYEYSDELAYLSLCVSLASFSADVSAWGEEGGEAEADRSRNLREVYAQMGFESVELFHYGTSLNDTSHKAAYGLGTKTLPSGETLLLVAVRGGGYGGEWSSNFCLGDGETHEGFEAASREICTRVRETLSRLDGRAVLWVTGYSRGGAVANLVGAFAHREGLLPGERIFGYTFGCPATVKETAVDGKTDYGHIFNLNTPHDPVAGVIPEAWGYTRYGVTVTFDGREETVKEVRQAYLYVTGGEGLPRGTIEAYMQAGQDLTAFLHALFPTAESAQKLYPVLMTYGEFSQCKVKDGEVWRNATETEFRRVLEARHGVKVPFAYVESFGSLEILGEEFLSFATTTEGQEQLHLFLTVWKSHGLSLLDLLAVLARMPADGDLGSVEHAAGMHHASLYLAWMFPEELPPLGDVNLDGRVNVADYVLLKRVVLGTLNPSAHARIPCDVTLDGKVNIADYTILKRVVLGTYTF